MNFSYKILNFVIKW